VGATSSIGTKRTNSNVRFPVANGGKPVMARTAQFGSRLTHLRHAPEHPLPDRVGALSFLERRTPRSLTSGLASSSCSSAIR